MGLKEMLFGGAEAKLKKHVARARNKDAQSADRFASLEALRADGSEAAIEGLLARFTIRYDKSIEDEQEKEFVCDVVGRMGEKALGPLERHLRSADAIGWGMRVLHSVTAPGSEARWKVLADLCERNDNSYTRDPQKKIDLIHDLGDEPDARATAALLPYLEDMNGDVRFSAVEALLNHKDDSAREPLLNLLVNEKEEVRRIKVRIVEGFCDLGWDVKGQSGTVEKLLPGLLAGARLDNHGRIKRKAS